MSLDHILLGLLGEPSTGYDLKRGFDEVFSHFWAAKQSQIYRTLKSLEEEGLVRSTRAPSMKGPPRRLYQRTEPGKRKLLTWLAEGPEIPTLRFPYLAQLFFMHETASLEQTETWLVEVVEEMEARLKGLREIESQFLSDCPEAPEDSGGEGFHAYLVLRHGLTRAQAALDWARESLERTRSRRTARDRHPDPHSRDHLTEGVAIERSATGDGSSP